MVKKIVVMILAIMTSTLMLSSCLEGRVWAKIRESIDLAKYDNMQTVEFDKHRYHDAISFLLTNESKDEEKLKSFYEEYSDIINSAYYSELASQTFEPGDGVSGFSEEIDYEDYYVEDFYNDCILASHIYDKYYQGTKAVLIHLDSELKITGYEVF